MWIVNKMTDRKSRLAYVFIASFLVSGMAAGAEPLPVKESIDMDLYKRGLQNLKNVSPNTEGKPLTNSMPSALADHFISFLYGEVYESINLSPKNRELVLVAGLIALGDNTTELSVHINGALNSGWTALEMQEVMLQMSVYSGLPSSVNGMNTLKEVLDQRKQRGITDVTSPPLASKQKTEKSRLEVGSNQLEKLQVIEAKALQDAYKDVSPNFAKHVIEYAFGEILSRPTLDYQTREMITIAALTAMGATNQLKFHIQGALYLGIHSREIADIIILVGAYSGFPSMANATNVLKEVLNKRK